MKVAAQNKIVVFVIFLLVAIVFGCSFFFMNRSLNPNIIKNKLIASDKLININNWEAEFYFCDPKNTALENCKLINNTAAKIDLPNVSPWSQVNTSERPNRVFLSHALTPAELQWVQRGRDLTLVIPNVVHRRTSVALGKMSASAIGMGADVSLSVTSQLVALQPEIFIEIDFDGYSWFGPTNLPVALVRPDFVKEYVSLDTKQVALWHVSRDIELGVRLVLSGMALVLDHSHTFFLLATYGGARAMRGFIPVIEQELGGLNLYLEFFYYFFNGVSCVLLWRFLLEFFAMPKNISAKKTWGSAIFGGFIFVLPRIIDAKYWMRVDSLSSMVEYCGAIIIVSYALFKFVKINMKQFERGQLSQYASIIGINIALMLVFFFAFKTSLGDLFLINKNQFVDIFAWQKVIVFPALIIVSLLEIGSTSKQMKAYARFESRRAVLEQELVIAREIQHQTLPSSKGQGEFFSWRALYVPLMGLGGDWFDIREMVMPNKQRVLAACVLDATGHGIGASLAASVISSHWGLFCKTIECNNFATVEERQACLQSGVQQINLGLLALRHNEGCTGILVLLFHDCEELLFVSAAHPGPLLITSTREVKYLRGTGNRLGQNSEGIWQVNTYKYALTDRLILYSDGIITSPLTTTSWVSGINRQARNQTKDVLTQLAQGVRKNRKEFKTNATVADDMTLLAISFNS